MMIVSSNRPLILGASLLLVVSIALGQVSDGTEAREYVVNVDGSASGFDPVDPGHETSLDAQVCVDNEEQDCKSFAEKGECANNWPYMSTECRSACRLCFDGEIPKEMTAWGEPQALHGGKDVEERARLTTKYMVEKVFLQPFFEKVRVTCKNNYADCVRWAAMGECDANPGFMQVQCAPSCFTCEKLDFSLRCPMDKNAKAALEPGDLNRLFERLIKDFPQYEPVVHSMPRPTDESIHHGPWVVTLDNFLTEEECDHLVKHGRDAGFERSFQFSGEFAPDGSEVRKSGTSRTSRNAWCAEESCYGDPVVQGVVRRMGDLVGIPQENSEFLQILHYQVGEFYKSHHDLIEYQRERPTGVRVLTFFLYLSGVEEGGGTLFNALNITVTPRKGRALVWPSVFNDRPHDTDQRTKHEALPVEAGDKYAANAWFHQYDFKKAFWNNCH